MKSLVYAATIVVLVIGAVAIGRFQVASAQSESKRRLLSPQAAGDLDPTFGFGAKVRSGFDMNADATYRGSGDYVVYNNMGNRVAIDGLYLDKTLGFRVYEGNGANTAADDSTYGDATLSTDYFRSLNSGDWDAPATWQSSHTGDFTDAITATLSPDSNANTITVRSPHIVTIPGTLAVTINETTIDSGAQVTVGGILVLSTAVPTVSLVVNGTLLNQGRITRVSFGIWEVGATGTFIHNSMMTLFDLTTILSMASFDSASTVIYRGGGVVNTQCVLSGKTYGNLKFESTSGAFNFVEGISVSPLTVSGALSIGVAGGGTPTLQTGFPVNVTGDTTIGANGRWTMTNAGVQRIAALNGNFVMASGGQFSPNNNQVNVRSNWSNAGTFNAGTGNVVFNGVTGQTITGDTTFYNFTKVVTAAQQMNFAAGSLTTVTNSLTLTGTAGNILSLRSTTDGTYWNIQVPTTRTVDYVNVKDSDNTTGVLVNPTNSVDAGHNVNWFAPPPPPAICTPPPSGIVAWYRGEDNGLDVFDLNDGTLLNGTTYSTGKVGRSFNLDGINDYIQMQVDVQPSAMPEVTFEAWVFPRNSTGADQAIIGGDDGGWDRQLGISPDGAFFRVQTGTINSFDAVPVDYNQWQHVAVVYTPTSVKVYKNGVEYSFGSAPTGQASVNKLALGSNRCPLCIQNGATQQFDGLIDEATVYNRALSKTELLSIYNADSAGKCLYCTPAPVGMASWYQAENDTNDVRSRTNGTPQGGIGYAPGKIGQAFNFDGIDDTVELGTGMASHDFSLSMWVKPGATQIQYADIVDNNHSKFQNWVIQQDGSNTNMYAFSGTPPFPLAPDVWQHLVVTHDSSDNSRAYVDGVLVASGTYAITYNGTQFLRLGRWANFHPDQGGNRYWNGQIDEFTIFDRPLTPIEVRNMYQAGGNGMCRPTATVKPTGVVGWWGGDGDALDISGNGNNGTLQNGASFAIDKVGQGFAFDGVDDYVSVAASQSLDVGSGNGFTLETWVNPVTLQGEQPIFEWNSGGPAEANLGLHFWISVVSQGGVSGNLYGNLIDTAGLSHRIQTPAVMTAGQFQHVALTYDKTNGTASIYRNGALVLSQVLGVISPRTSMPLYLGYRPGSLIFSGKLDEASIYNRSLSSGEIESIYNAGLGGKLKTVVSPADSPVLPSGNKRLNLSPDAVSTLVGDVTVNFGNVATGGITQEIPLDPALLPPLPGAATPTGLMYDIDTSALFTGNVDLCFNVPALSSIPASELRVFHLEAGAWVNRTASGATHSAVCTTGVTSLSPFAVARLIPTSANASVSGRAVTAAGQGIRNAVITLSDSSGQSRTARTGSFGFYRLDDVAVGENYVLTISSKRFTFINQTRIISVSDDVTDADFIAIE